MSDYLFSSLQQTEGKLAQIIKNIYDIEPPETREFHGKWGTLAVSQGYYNGFKPYETEQHIFIVIGGPVLYFRDNDFLVENDSYIASKAIYERWIIENKMQWDEDLSGPFTILLIDKKDKKIKVVTDLMAFIPVYAHQTSKFLFVGTHVDALSNATKESRNFDIVSLADFILNDVVTYPYTTYKNIYQLAPSSQITLSGETNLFKVRSYWEPKECNPYTNVKEASKALRGGVDGYVNRVTNKMSKVAQFISGGEDSRALSGMLPSHLQRDAYVFLDSMNVEGKIAKKVADRYNAKFIVGFREKTHYLNILPEASKLVGMGHQYHHAHSLGFDKKFKLAEYTAVFGGYLSDSLLKSPYALSYTNTGRYPFIPDVFKKGETQTQKITSPLINEGILCAINKRRLARFKVIKKLRPISAHEWFVLYPATMRTAIPNLYTTRRLFRSYEPFMCKESVKISAALPTRWKNNRRLFNYAMKPYLTESKWMLHADGRFPYFPWWVNSPIQFCIWLCRHVAKRIGNAKENQGPWGDWIKMSQSVEWKKIVDNHCENIEYIGFEENDCNIRKILTSDKLPLLKKINLLQVLSNYKSTNK
tara:strand:+ start:2338 stop:4107 length:1770 start_codon:yes stop_codon:yes gene_type:complete